jgi:Flp pilus assembly protein TadG
VNERGSASAELVICTPILILVAVVALAIGRLVLQQSQVVDVARDAAEAASIWPTGSAAQTAALTTASYELVHDNLRCIDQQIDVDTADLAPGGQVSVQVTCVVELSNDGLPGLPATVTLHAAAVAPVEEYRELG